MTNTSKTQTRGNCQCCGNEQAVVRGFMSKHGYTVKHGWFVGVCTGQHSKPMQVERKRTDEIVAQVREDVAALRIVAAELESGERDPGAYKESRIVDGKRVDVSVPFADAPWWKKDGLRKAAVWNTNQRASMGEGFANELEAMADRVHGQPLTVIAAAAPAAPIRRGEVRTAEGSLTLTCDYVDGARVYWKAMRGDKPVKGWTGTQAWRRMTLVEQQAAA